MSNRELKRLAHVAMCEHNRIAREINAELISLRKKQSQGTIEARTRHYEADVYSRRIKPKRNNHASRPRDFIYTRSVKRS